MCIHNADFGDFDLNLDQELKYGKRAHMWYKKGQKNKQNTQRHQLVNV